jgi:hypothetical protein
MSNFTDVISVTGVTFPSVPVPCVAIATQLVPSKHLSISQSHVLIEWLLDGAHPHAPIRHVFGKSLALPQHSAVVTVPPELVHAVSAALGVGVLCWLPEDMHPSTTARTTNIPAINNGLFIYDENRILLI